MEQKNAFSLTVFLALCGLPLLAVFFPRALSFAPAMIGGLGMLWFVFKDKNKMAFPKTYFLWVGAIGALWMASCFWSVNFNGSFEKVIQSFPVLLFGVAIFSLCQVMPIEKIRSWLWVFPLCLAFASTLIAIDLYFNMPIYRMTRGMTMDASLSSAEMNRGIVVVVLCLFSAVLFLNVWDGPKAHKYALSGFLILSVSAMLILTQSQSAQIAVLAGFFFFLFFPYKTKYAYSGLRIVFTLLLVLAPWIALWMWGNLLGESQENTWLKEGYAANRMEIWGFVSVRILENPLYGFGLEATKLIGNFDHVPIFQKDSSILHPHNFALQIWIEFGLLGVFLMAALIGSLLVFIQNQTQGIAARVCLATLMAVLAVSAVGYGMWQSWWLGLLIYLLSLCVLATRLEQISCQKGEGPL